MTDTVVPAGTTVTSTTVSAGDTLVLFGSGISTTVDGAGFEDVESGGVASATTVLSNGAEYVSSGGSASGTVVSSGGVAVVLSGGRDSGTEVLSGGIAHIYGIAIDTSVASGGRGTIESGGFELVFNDASGVTISGGGVAVVLSGGRDSGTEVLSGGIAHIYGSAIDTFVDFGGLGTIESGGFELVFNDARGVTISGGGFEDVLSGGVALSTTVLSNGAEYVSSGGVASRTVVSGGGFEVVLSGGTASDTVVSSGGSQTVLSGGTASGTVVSSGGFAVVLSGGTANRTLVSSGGSQTVLSGGTAVLTTVLSDGAEYVSSGGSASLTVVRSGGVAVVLSGGVASGTHVGGITRIYGSAIDTDVSPGGLGTIESGGFELVFRSGGGPSGDAASGVTISGGGFEDVESGGVASATTVLSDGAEYVSSGGTASGTVVSSGGFAVVLSGGVASGTTVGDGGHQIVSSGGLVSGTVLDSGGIERVWGTASGAVVNGDGFEVVESGGLAIGATINTRGFETVESGGTAVGTTVLSDGAQYVSSGGIASGAIVSSGGFEVVLSGGRDSGTEVLSGGIAHIYGIAIDTSVASVGLGTIESGGFELVFNHASGMTVSSGGTEIVSSGGVESAVTIAGGLVEVESGGSATLAIFAGSGTLQLDDSAHFSGAVTAFVTPQDRLDLRDISFGSGTTVSYTPQHTSGTLTVTDGRGTASFTVEGIHTLADFTIEGDGSGGTLVEGGSQVDAWSGIGNWTNDISNWSTGAPPTATEDAEIAAGAAALDSAAPVAVNSLTIDQIGQLNVTGSELDVASRIDVLGLLTIGDYYDFNTNRPVTITSPVTVTAATLDVNGDIQITGDGANQAALIVSGPAGFGTEGVISSDVEVSDNGLLQFGSGALTSISASGSLILAGNEEVQIAGDTSLNSALSRLSSNAGQIDLQGVQLAPQGDFTNSGVVTINASAEVAVADGHSYIQTAGTTTVSGSLAAPSIEVDGGVVDFQSALTGGDGTGTLDIGAQGTVRLEHAVDSSHGVVFTAAGGTLELDDSEDFRGTVDGFTSPQDRLDLRDIAPDGLELSYTQQTGSGTLQVSTTVLLSGGHLVIEGTADITLLGTHSQSDFSLAEDGVGGTLVTDPPSTGNGVVAAGVAGSLDAAVQIITVAPGDEPLTAGAGPEIFDFSSLGFGHDTIAGFAPTQDAVRLNGSLAADFATVQSDMSSTAGGTLIALDRTHSITLSGVAPASLTAANFRFA